MPRLPAVEHSITAESQKRLLKIFDHPRLNTVIPCLTADENSNTEVKRGY